MDRGDTIADNLRKSINGGSFLLPVFAGREHIVDRDQSETSELHVNVIDGSLVTEPAARKVWSETHTTRIAVQQNLERLQDERAQVDQLNQLTEEIVKHLTDNRRAPVIAAITAVRRPEKFSKEKLHKQSWYEAVIDVESRLTVTT